jgi:predicted GNAT family acetyltransferase
MDKTEKLLDEAVEETFPASDPISLNPEEPITDNAEESRFERRMGSALATIDYQRSAEGIDLTWVEVPGPQREKGAGTSFVMAVLDRLRADKVRVVASCPFIKQVVAKNAEYQDFVEVR